MSIQARQPAISATTAPTRSRPAWLDFLMALAYVSLVMPVRILGWLLQGFLWPHTDPDKYRPFEPDSRKEP